MTRPMNMSPILSRLDVHVEELSRHRDRVAGVDRLEVLPLAPAVEDPVEAALGPRVHGERLGDHAAEERGGDDDVGVAVLLGELRVAVEGVVVADGLGEALHVPPFDGIADRLGLHADGGAHLFGDDFLGHTRLRMAREWGWCGSGTRRSVAHALRECQRN